MKRNWKKPVIALAALSFVAAACGSDDAASDTTEAPATVGEAAADATVTAASVAAPVEMPVDVPAVSVSWQETQPLL